MFHDFLNVQINDEGPYIPDDRDYVLTSDDRLIDLNEEPDFPIDLPSDRSISEQEPFYKEDYDQLTQGIKKLDCRHRAASIIVAFGEQAFPIATNDGGSLSIAGSYLGEVSYY